MTIQDAGRHLLSQLSAIYDDREAVNIAKWVMERLTGWTRIDQVVNKDVALTAPQRRQLENYTTALLAHKPVQYVLHEAWFYGMKLYVDENVLIPRPETEELVDWIVNEVRSLESGALSRESVANSQNMSSSLPAPDSRLPTILDIGTGSGCIALGLKKGLPEAEVHALDVSPGALATAGRNATEQQLDIRLHEVDFLSEQARAALPSFDIIVSNPPYIPVRDKATMAANVLNHEPHLALFVDNDDPLQYYKAIAAFAKKHLRPAGSVYMEIHEEAGNAVVALFRQSGFAHTLLRKDLQGKNRMVKAAL